MEKHVENILSPGQFKQCTVCAYQESGHILFAYLCGYRCQQAELVEDTSEDFSSISVFDYGEDSVMANKFLAHRADFFDHLALDQEFDALEVGRKLSLLFLGGSVAAAIYHNNENVHIPLPMQIEYGDLIQVEFIDQVLGKLDPEHHDNFVENQLQDALYTLSNVNLWQTVTDLAKRLLQYRQLDRNDIEECLEEHGVIYNEASPLQSATDIEKA